MRRFIAPVVAALAFAAVAGFRRPNVGTQSDELCGSVRVNGQRGDLIADYASADEHQHQQEYTGQFFRSHFQFLLL